MKLLLVALASIGTLAAGTVSASEKLAQASGCLTCHAVNKKVIGPSFHDIAAKYKNDQGAAAKLAQKVKAGGAGVWGSIPMPPNAHLKTDDISTLVQWVLSQK